MNLWWRDENLVGWEEYPGGIFYGGGISKFSASRGGTPTLSHSRKNSHYPLHTSQKTWENQCLICQPKDMQKPPYKRLYEKSYGYNAAQFLQGDSVQDLKVFGEEGHFSNIANIKTTQYLLLIFWLD